MGTYIKVLTFAVFATVCKIISASNENPHIIFILADDAGWNDFSFHGSAQIPTPNIDALAFSGAILNSYYASPLCTPTRGAIMTGKHPIHLGLQHMVIVGDTADCLPLTEKLLPQHLKDLGYSTHLVGKWHLGHYKQVCAPTSRGFDTHYGYWMGMQDYYNHTNSYDDVPGVFGYDFRNGMVVDKSTIGKYNTDLLTNESIRLIENHPSDQSMFLMVAHTAPHAGNDYDPLQAPEENIEKFKDTIQDENRRVYAAMVDKLDESVGQIVSALEKKGMLESAIVIFASDNGGAPEGMHNNYGSNWPLRGTKDTVWEGGTRVAACIWSKEIKNRVSNDIIHALDWLPTLYEAAGGNLTNLGGIDGISVWDSLISGEPTNRMQFLYNIDDVDNSSAIRVGPWKLIQGNTTNRWYGSGKWDGWFGHYPFNTSVVELIPKILESNVALAISRVSGKELDPQQVEELQNESKLNCCNESQPIICDPYNKPCLFNIYEDPCESRNLAGERSELVVELLELLNKYNATAREIIDQSPHPEADPRHWDGVWINWGDYVWYNVLLKGISFLF